MLYWLLENIAINERIIRSFTPGEKVACFWPASILTGENPLEQASLNLKIG